MFNLVQLGLHCTETPLSNSISPPPLDMVKLIHYEARTGGLHPTGMLFCKFVMSRFSSGDRRCMNKEMYHLSMLCCRKPLYYLFNLLLPCLFISMTTILVFYLPAASGEKVSLGVTVLLTLAVFLLMLAESMPPQSETVPILGKVVSGSTTFATNTILQLNPHNYFFHEWTKTALAPFYFQLINMPIL